jgi:transcriptional regulator with XRE-family HTH domain
MKKPVHLPIPAMRTMRKLGSDINHARRRRRVSVALMAERAGLSKGTISKIERGDPTTSIGGYATVLFVLGMIDRLGDLVDAAHDIIGRQLEDENLPKRIRIPNKFRNNIYEDQHSNS